MEKLLGWVGRRNKKEIFFLCWVVIPFILGTLDGGLNSNHLGSHPNYEYYIIEYANAFVFPFVMLFLRQVIRNSPMRKSESNS